MYEMFEDLEPRVFGTATIDFRCRDEQPSTAIASGMQPSAGLHRHGSGLLYRDKGESSLPNNKALP